MDIMLCVDSIGQNRFSLYDMYAFENHLQRKYPNNEHIKEKIRWIQNTFLGISISILCFALTPRNRNPLIISHLFRSCKFRQQFCCEYRPIDTNAAIFFLALLNRFHHATGTTTNSASHVFLQR